MKKRILTVLVTLCAAVGLLSATALAAEGETYLVLGDSISTGYGLAQGQQSFVEQVAQARDYTVVSHAVDGFTAPDILAQFESGQLDGDIRAADFITITVGGNDMMDPMYRETAALYNQGSKNPIAPEDIADFIMNSDASFTDKMIMISCALTVLEGSEEDELLPFLESESFLTALADFEENLYDVMAYIRKLNPVAHVVVTTQYHPYRAFRDYEGFEEMAEIMDKEVSACAEKLRDTVIAGAEEHGYLVADVYTAFDQSGQNLCNASVMPQNLDFHPNAAGHTVIAQTILDVELPEIPAGTISGTITGGAGASITIGGQDITAGEDGSFSIPAEGTFDVVIKKPGCLTITVKGVVSKGGQVILPEVQMVAGDVNGDDKINISDMGAFRQEFGKVGGNIANGLTDVNGDGKVNIADMGIFRQNFGKTAGKDCTIDF